MEKHGTRLLEDCLSNIRLSHINPY